MPDVDPALAMASPAASTAAAPRRPALPDPLAAPAPWGTHDVVRGLASAIAVVAAALVATSVLALGLDLDRAAVVLAATVALDAALVWIAWRFSVHKYGCSWAALGFRPPRLEEMRWAVPAGLFVSLAIAAIYGGIIKSIGLSDRVSSSGAFDDAGTAARVAAVFMAVAVAPVAEETFFRGFLFRGLRGRMGFLRAALIVSGLFAIAHVQPIVFVPIFFIGWVLAWVYAGTGSLFNSILVHMTYNGLILALAFSV